MHTLLKLVYIQCYAHMHAHAFIDHCSTFLHTDVFIHAFHIWIMIYIDTYKLSLYFPRTVLVLPILESTLKWYNKISWSDSSKFWWSSDRAWCSTLKLSFNVLETSLWYIIWSIINCIGICIKVIKYVSSYLVLSTK